MRESAVSSGVRVTEQSFDDTQKAQARTNIGAPASTSGSLTTPTLTDAVLANTITTSGVQALTTAAGAGAVNVTTFLTQLTSTGTDALTLANGTAGQLKRIVMVVSGGVATLTPTTKTGYTSVIFTNAGESVLLQYHTTYGWTVVAYYAVTFL